MIKDISLEIDITSDCDCQFYMSRHIGYELSNTTKMWNIVESDKDLVFLVKISNVFSQGDDKYIRLDDLELNLGTLKDGVYNISTLVLMRDLSLWNRLEENTIGTDAKGTKHLYTINESNNVLMYNVECGSGIGEIDQESRRILGYIGELDIFSMLSNGIIYKCSSKAMVNICSLRKCFMRYNNLVLSEMSKIYGINGLCNTKSKSKDLENNKYFRDLLSISIDAIEYASSCGDYDYVNKIITQLSSCNGICSDTQNKNGMSRKRCGCSR